MTRELRRSEQLAFKVVEQALGAAIEPFDDGSVDRMVDGHIQYPDGHQAALEVTTLADEREMQSAALLDRDKYKWPAVGVEWMWFIEVSGEINHKQLKPRLSALLRFCESVGITSSHDPRFWDPRITAVPPDLLGWIRKRALQMYGDPKSAGNGAVWVMNRSIGGIVPELDVIPAWITAELVTPVVRENVAKLLADGLPETHLFLWLAWHGVPDGIVFALLDGDGEPGISPTLPAGLSWIWIAAEGAKAVWGWSESSAWLRADVPSPNNV